MRKFVSIAFGAAFLFSVPGFASVVPQGEKPAASSAQDGFDVAITLDPIITGQYVHSRQSQVEAIRDDRRRRCGFCREYSPFPD